MPSHLQNWNFNVSHHGKYVAIASEPVCLVRIAAQYGGFTAAPVVVETMLGTDGRRTRGWLVAVALAFACCT